MLNCTHTLRKAMILWYMLEIWREYLVFTALLCIASASTILCQVCDSKQWVSRELQSATQLRSQTPASFFPTVNYDLLSSHGRINHMGNWATAQGHQDSRGTKQPMYFL